jgi:hypothetical protein
MAASFESTRDPDHEVLRMMNVVLTSPECQKPSKGLRTSLQSIVLLCAGEEVAMAGDMHPPEKWAMLASKLEAHKTKLISELETLSLKSSGTSLPPFFRDAILNSNNTGKKWIVSPKSGTAWKKMKRIQGFMRNHCLPLWKSLTKGKALPSGVALDEVILNFVKLVGMIKVKGEYYLHENTFFFFLQLILFVRDNSPRRRDWWLSNTL